MHADEEETNEIQADRIECFKKKSDRQFTVLGRTAEITVDLVSQARAQMSDIKVNGPDDAIVSEMIKKLHLEKCAQSRGVFKNASWTRWNLQARETGLLAKTGRCTEEGDQKHLGNCAAISNVEVAHFSHCSSLGEGKRN